MAELLIGNDTAVITMLLLFIVGMMTGRFVPWWVHDDLKKKLAEYEEAAPELIKEVRRLMIALDEAKAKNTKKTEEPLPPRKIPYSSVRPRRIKRRAGRIGNDQ